jgi:hypothetical protein
MHSGKRMFDDLPEFLAQCGVTFDGRNFDNMDWLEDEQTCAMLNQRGFSIAMEALDENLRRSIPKNIDYRAVFTLGRACAQFLDDRNRGLESPIANLALHSYIEQLVQNGEPDVFFEHQCRLQLIKTDLLINYTTFREAIAEEGMGEDAIRHRYLDHATRWANNITQLIESLNLIGNPERPLNFNDPAKLGDTIFDYYICLAQAVRSMMLQFSFMQPILDLETAKAVLTPAVPLFVQSIESLAPHREHSSAQYILFQGINAHMGIFMDEYTGHKLPIESLLDQCNRATVHLENLSPVDEYSTLFAHLLRVGLCTQREELAEQLEQVREDASLALEASTQVGNYDAYHMILNQFFDGEQINDVVLSDELAHMW